MRAWLCAALALGLVACASPAWEKPGTPRQAVLDQLGAPVLRTPLPDGGERLIYSTLPMGREVYHMDFGPNGRLARTEQVLTFKHFSSIPAGQWTVEDVRRTFGPPFLVEHVASFTGDIWTYRFMDDINLKRMAHVHIDPQGIVRKVMFTDEPRMGDDRFFFF